MNMQPAWCSWNQRGTANPMPDCARTDNKLCSDKKDAPSQDLQQTIIHIISPTWIVRNMHITSPIVRFIMSSHGHAPSTHDMRCASHHCLLMSYKMPASNRCLHHSTECGRTCLKLSCSHHRASFTAQRFLDCKVPCPVDPSITPLPCIL